MKKPPDHHAIVKFHEVDKFTPRRKREVAAWLRTLAATIEGDCSHLSSKCFTAKFMR